ncbi:septation ring formation regulator EzrA [Aquibacillus koreensis]|uniref:Septation ring formation regulator EzrA n=1 Tax=Aquibacillus koreensis TaxID=279446 RepID=A0A9X3WIM8_9BACI|nr:septation ring formation regulator EzrA [Aquibacillus koreensis]MCT2534996.1 septation ring formation regulator EzrA [Aquibacillus koreensis]MDC3419283.1 septation ring formation regulator EzrA [Aquibacillus koreensis]
MAYVIGSILVIIALIIFGLILRKRVYDEVDRLESWKMDIMNRNVTSELARVKSLNLSGETQEKFEAWKGRWDQILTKELPDIEEFLLDAEESADRFRIPSSKQYLRAVDDTLRGIEINIDQMFNELEQLLDSEQNTRKDVEQIIPTIKGLRKTLLKQRHLFGKAEIQFDVEIDKIESELKKYHYLVETGNYFEAQQLVSGIKESVSLLEQKLDEFPNIFKRCKNELPAQVDELFAGIKNMKEEGYRIEHLGFEKELQAIQQSLMDAVVQLESGDTSNVFEIVEPIEERLNEMYHLLEKEAVAKSYVEKHMTGYFKLIDEVGQAYEQMNEEVELLQETYYLEQSDLELHMSLEKWVNQLEKQYEQLQVDIKEEKITNIEIKEKIETGFKELVDLKESQEEFKEQIKTIRKDEINAKQRIVEMRKELFETNRKLQKSNIPGVPSFIWELLQEASQKSEVVLQNLEGKPLDMGKVQHSLGEADKAVQAVVTQTEQLLEQAYLVETVIQYANRYRSQYALLAAKLYEAERKFRNFEYENALEEAASALEAIEPGALKRLEEYIKIPS